MFDQFNGAHDHLVVATNLCVSQELEPIPISIVSLKSEEQSQLVIFDGRKFNPEEVVKRLRLAATMIENQLNQGEQNEQP